MMSVDFKVAFDSARRNSVLHILAYMSVPCKIFVSLSAILQRNNISVDDEVVEKFASSLK